MRRSVDEARRERVFTSQLLEGMVSAVAAIDENDRIRSANAAFFRIFPRATIGASVYEKFASEPAMKMLEAATATLVDKAAYRGRWVCPPGEDCEHEQAFDVYSSPLAINGAHGQILTLVDVTEAAEAERGLAPAGIAGRGGPGDRAGGPRNSKSARQHSAGSFDAARQRHGCRGLEHDRVGGTRHQAPEQTRRRCRAVFASQGAGAVER